MPFLHPQSNDTSVEAYEGDPEDDEDYEEEEQVGGAREVLCGLEVRRQHVTCSRTCEGVKGCT